MAEAKTRPTGAKVSDFLASVTDPERREDCGSVVELMRSVTGEEPQMWGSSIVGFGRYRYEYASGRSGEWPVSAFSPRKTDLTLYLVPDYTARFPDLMDKLGKYKTGKSCLYIKRLSDVNVKVLRQLIRQSVAAMAPERIRPA